MTCNARMMMCDAADASQEFESAAVGRRLTVAARRLVTAAKARTRTPRKQPRCTVAAGLAAFIKTSAPRNCSLAKTVSPFKSVFFTPPKQQYA